MDTNKKKVYVQEVSGVLQLGIFSFSYDRK